ncbi:MAG: hypothetical protein HYW86_04940 [Candidatus Roizmanbacteria bacterium]|nr:MAG: hypothetical protein HYW86_04940 [Candidatus Roizmanbacteria bacterium]
MDIQTIFYILGIAVMISWFILIIVAAVFLWMTYRKVEKLKSEATEKVESITRLGKSEIIKVAAGAVLGYFLNRLRKKKERSKI